MHVSVRLLVICESCSCNWLRCSVHTAGHRCCVINVWFSISSSALLGICCIPGMPELRHIKQQQQQQRPLPQLLSELGVCFVRLLGLLVDKINQHEYPAVSSDSMTSLSAFLDHPALLDLLQRQSRTDCMPLHLAVLSIFAVHNCSASARWQRRC